MSNHPLSLAVEIDGFGAHPAAWRASSARPSAVFDPRELRRTVLAAENSGFALVTIDDALTRTEADTTPGGVAGRLDAVVRASFAAQETTRLSFAPRIHPRAVEPFHVAAQLASLDIATLGRSAWLVGDDDQPALADAIDRVVPETQSGRSREVADVVTTVRRLWDSWEDDAVIKEVETGRYIDRDRIHNVEVVTDTFSVTGALITPRPPQGQPVVLAPAEVLDPKEADVTLVGGDSAVDVIAASRAARESGASRVFVEIETILDTERLSTDRLAELDSLAPWPPSARLRFDGSAYGLVALLEELHDSIDGVRLHPAVLTDDIPVLTRYVLPRLFTARTARAPLAGQTLRGVLGLPRPANIFSPQEDAA